MNTDNMNQFEDDFNEGLEDIEQMLKPQCEFKASKTLKDDVLAQARAEVKPRRKVTLWPWVAAACAVGFLMLWFTPPEETKRDAALHARLVKEYKAEHEQRAYVRTSDYESFEDIERRMRGRGEQLIAENKMQLYK